MYPVTQAGGRALGSLSVVGTRFASHPRTLPLSSSLGALPLLPCIMTELRHFNAFTISLFIPLRLPLLPFSPLLRRTLLQAYVLAPTDLSHPPGFSLIDPSPSPS